MKSRFIDACLLGVFCCSAVPLRAADCAALKSLKLPDTTITMAEEATDVAGPQIDPPEHGLPEFCRVAGILRPTADSEIRFEVWLPASGWNGRFLGVGNGGFAGSIYYRQLGGNLRRGFATAGSDAGHAGEAGEASWALGHPEKIKDFGWRAVHLTTGRAKDIILAYYGKPAAKAYFDACSDGGREALMEAQRFPEDYDGILAGAPANNWAHMVTSGAAVAQATRADPRGYIPRTKLAAIQRAALAECDGRDGVKDGIIADPTKCRFRPESLLCKGADSADCLTQPQVNSLKALYAGGVDSHGKKIFPGFAPGDESGWKDWIIGPGPGEAYGDGYAQNYFRYMVIGDPKFNTMTANVDELLAKAQAATGADLDSTNPDLTPFAARGGKLIVYHGWDDPAISPWNSVAYYKSVQQTMGADKSESFLRLYMVPGMEHCVGGPGPDFFGQLGTPTSQGPKFGVFDGLVDWVEQGTAPGTVIATKYTKVNGENKATMTRPVCAYPQVAKYKGAGDIDDAASFTCAID